MQKGNLDLEGQSSPLKVAILITNKTLFPAADTTPPPDTVGEVLRKAAGGVGVNPGMKQCCMECQHPKLESLDLSPASVPDSCF